MRAVRGACGLNECGSCGLDFTSVSAFDRHRVGVHEYKFSEGQRMDPPREDGRRCLVPSELRDKGFKQNERGQWFDPARRDAAREFFSSRVS